MTEFCTPIGRMVQGNVFVPQTKNMKGAPLVNKDGSPRVEYYTGLAIEKTNPEVDNFINVIKTAAMGFWPAGQHAQPNFSWKYLDGDLPPNNTKPGFAGHWVFRFTNGFPIKAYEHTANGPVPLLDQEKIKCGYYMRVYGNIASNKSADDPGIYLNFSMVELRGFGELIQTGPDGVQVFGENQAAHMPAGMSNTPVVGGSTPAPTVPATPAATVPPPNTQFLAPPPAPPTTPPMTPKANGVPYEKYIEVGWSDEALRAEGYIV